MQTRDVSAPLLAEWTGYGRSQVQHVIAGDVAPSEAFRRRAEPALRAKGLAWKGNLWRALTRGELERWTASRDHVVRGPEGRPDRVAPGRPIYLALWLYEHKEINRRLLYQVAGIGESTLYKMLGGQKAPTPHTRKAVVRALAAMGHRQFSYPDLFAPIEGAVPDDLFTPRHNPRIRCSDVMGPALRIVHEKPFTTKRRPRKMIPVRMLNHWELTRNPFGDPNTAEEVFLNKDMTAALDVLREAARTQEFIALVGPIGSGKSTIINKLLHDIESNQRDRNKFCICHLQCVQKENVKGRHILEALIADLPGDARPKQTSESMTRQVIDIVQNVREKLGRWPVLIVEEAQGLSKEGFRVLKRIRESTRDGYRKGLAVILVGQTESHPDLVSKLEAVDLREVRERCHMISIAGLNGDVREYVNLKLRFGGCKKTTGIVDDSAIVALIDHYSGAVSPQSIDRILTDALIQGFKDKAPVINGQLIQSVI